MLISILLGAAILAAAAWILARRLWRFIKTKGRSGCESCPYSGQCRGERCGK